MSGSTALLQKGTPGTVFFSSASKSCLLCGAAGQLETIGGPIPFANARTTVVEQRPFRDELKASKRGVMSLCATFQVMIIV